MDLPHYTENFILLNYFIVVKSRYNPTSIRLRLYDRAKLRDQ